MKFLVFFAVLAAFVSFSPIAAQDLEAGRYGDSCQANCVVLIRTADSLLILARDQRGRIFRAVTVALPDAAQPVSERQHDRHLGSDVDQENQSGLPVGSTCAGVAGVCTEHSSLTYETPTHYVIVSITYFFFNGELQDIDVDETRLTKSKIK